MTTVADKERIRMSLKNLVLEEPNFINDLVSELSEDLKKSKQNHLERIINEDFEEYKEVFKTLA
jgi:hypothetical protein